MKGNRMTKYFSENHQRFLNIANMTDQHVRNAFVKMCNRNKDVTTQDALYAQEQGNRAERLQDRVIELQNTIRKLNSQPTVTADAYDVAWKKIETLEKENKKLKNEFSSQFDYSKNIVRDLRAENARLVDKLERDDHGVGEIERQRDDAIFDLKQERNRAMMYAEMLNDKCPNGHAYVFSEIPNDDDGREFVQKMKGYLNKESYKLRVKGQYLDEETKKTEGWKVHQYGQPISKSKCLRVYVDVKK